MRTYEEVKRNLVALRNRYLKERMKAYLEQKPINCSFSRKGKINGSKCLLCDRPDSFEIEECNCAKCRGCSEFVCRNTEESVISDFNAILASPSRCGQEYPKLALLLWFLQDFNPKVEKPIRKSFWKSLFGR